jgi:hypothetical protein
VGGQGGDAVKCTLIQNPDDETHGDLACNDVNCPYGSKS